MGVLIAAFLLFVAGSQVQGQLRRNAAVQPVAEATQGAAFVSLGMRYETDVRFPLSGLQGDLTSVPYIHLAYSLSDRSVFEVRGTAWQMLSVKSSQENPAVLLDPGVADGSTADVGDFELSFSFLPVGSPSGFSAGAHIVSKLPNTDETKGIGPNTTDVTIAGLFSWGAQNWRATGWIGVGILEAPVKSFEQNDVLSYAVEWLYRMNEHLRVAVGARGRASTRGVIPLGTEDLGEFLASGEWKIGELLLDVGFGHGFTKNSSDWLLEGGMTWVLAR